MSTADSWGAMPDSALRDDPHRFTSVSSAHRTISQVLTDGTTVRYSLTRSLNGDVYWRADVFAAIDDHVEPMRWLNHLAA